MKVTIVVDSKLKDPEIIIKCPEENEEYTNLKKWLLDKDIDKPLPLYKNERQYYVSPQKILFFETEENNVYAHLSNEVYKIKNRLYELEKVLPNYFIRISKSTIVNVNHIYSINHNISSYSLIQFHNSHKQVYVSRFYNKVLKQKLEKRN